MSTNRGRPDRPERAQGSQTDRLTYAASAWDSWQKETTRKGLDLTLGEPQRPRELNSVLMVTLQSSLSVRDLRRGHRVLGAQQVTGSGQQCL